MKIEDNNFFYNSHLTTNKRRNTMKKSIYTIFLMAVLFPVLLSAQVIVKVPSDNPPQEGNLNNAVQAAITAGTLSNTIFQLEPQGYYVLIGTINVPAGQRLRIEAPEPGTTSALSPPQIIWTSSGGINTQYNFDCFGDISLKNVWLMYARTTGDQVGSCLSMEDNTNPNGQRGEFEGVIFDYSSCPQNVSSGAVSVACKHFKGTFKNCYFKNCIDKHFRYYGRACSFPYDTKGWHTDSVSFENCTFANMGYVFMQENGEYSDYVKFNHCTFLNIVVFPLESGWWNKLTVTNSIFVNCNMFGYNQLLDTNGAYGGTLRVDSTTTFGFTVPYTDQTRRILFTNSSYSVDPWLVDYMKTNPYSKKLHQERRDLEIPLPEPMLSASTLRFFDSTANGKKVFPYINRANLYDNTNPNFILPPTDTTMVKEYMLKKWDNNKDTNWAWKPQNDINFLWPLEENLAYKDATLKTAAMGGFPLGDLYHWWPTQYLTWKLQSTTENATIANWLQNGLTSVREIPGAIPADYKLSQNYPNPFNPTTQIEYSVPLTGHVSLKVFNTLGQEVTTLFDGIQKAGKYVATFDGRGLASDVYFYKLQSGGVSITKKLVLMK
jgi:hypothetical protein